MASTSSSFQFFMKLRCCSVTNHQRFFLGKPRSTESLPFCRVAPSMLLCSRRRKNSSPAVTSSSRKNKKKEEDDDDLDEDAFEALFRQLEEDLKNDSSADNDDDDDITEEDLAKLEQELDEALRDDELLGVLDLSLDENGKIYEHEDDESSDEEQEGDGDDEEDETPLKLKSWQLRRLAYALKKGKRKTSIKNLAADLCLDRAFVLDLLREPPPNLLMLSATLPDEADSGIVGPEAIPQENLTLDSAVDTSSLSSVTVALEAAKDEEDKRKVPVHVMQSSWSARKRLKKVQVETLERIYSRTKRPTNAMISSIVHVTNLPRKKIIKWFEDKRSEDGVPDCRLPYQRPEPESLVTS